MKDLGTYGDEAKKALVELVKLHASQLGEHVDYVQIFVGMQMEGGNESRTYEYGTGMFQSRLGHVHEWLTIQDEYARQWARDKASEDSED